MYRVYELFEVMPTGSPRMVSVVSGLEFAKAALQRLAKDTTNECYIADRETRQIMMQINVARATRAARRIFHIAYDEYLGLRRSELLRARGYAVISVSGNEAAKLLLSSIQHFDLFIVGHAAPEETRREIVGWLKAEYPGVKILALNPPHQQVLRADCNARQNRPGTWLPIVAQLLGDAATTPGAQ